ncbi:MAG TPA: M23 family metallopeptidase, partial [Polyangiales bacterium]|nr:M23 family metallopeptidase [Polyangiales bacterium]
MQLAVLFCVACDGGLADEATVPASRVVQAVTCDVALARYPVMGRHNNGYDSTAGDHSQWSCGDANSNSDFVAGDHLGNDIWAEEGTPVVATVAGQLTLTGFSDYSGNKVTLVDDCGWYHFYAHLQSIAPGMVDGVRVQPGDVVGAVGNTGTASNGVIHLHYSIYPDGNYDAGINPWPALHAVEQNVCA